MNPTLLNDCIHSSFAGTTTFPEIVGRLIGDNIQWYSSNLLFGVTTYYAPEGAHHQAAWPGWSVPPIADAFDAEKVSSAIRASQKGEIIYPAFLARIAEAGTVYYTVHLQGRKALYFGRHGDFHMELFPTKS